MAFKKPGNCAVVYPDGSYTFHCEGQPVEGVFSDGYKPTRFLIEVSKNNMLTYSVCEGSRTPGWEDVLKAVLEATAGYDPVGGVFHEKNGVGVEYVSVKAGGQKYSMGRDWQGKLSFRGTKTVPCAVAKALALEIARATSERTACDALAQMAETMLEIGRRAGVAVTAGRPLPALRATSPEGGGKAGGDKPLPYGETDCHGAQGAPRNDEDGGRPLSRCAAAPLTQGSQEAGG